MASNGNSSAPHYQNGNSANGHGNGTSANGHETAKPSNGYENGKSANGYGHASAAAYKAAPVKNAPSKVQPEAKHGILDLRRSSRRPVPTDMGDGSYRQIIKRPTIWQDMRTITFADIKTLKDLIAAKVKGETQADDKTMVMERTIALVAGLPSYSKRREMLTNTFIDMLWNSLDHPPLLYMGDKFRFRQPDGSYNNPLIPKLGAAGTPYSRTVKPGKINAGALPDPESVYESVMARDGFKKNPNNVSSILWYWATIIIHDLFSTDMTDGNINNASSYLDLSPLYGSTQEAIDSIRTFQDGKLKPDTFADRRMIGNPPGVCIILIMFNRVHNHIATTLADINEGGRFTKPAPNLEGDAAAAAWKTYDEELFQTARLVTSGLYINITLIDYVRNIVNLNRVDTTWTLDPRQEMGVSVGTKEGSESGVGNVVSAEFNLCYRWHSCISEMDDQWIQNFYKGLLGDDYGELNMQALVAAMKKFQMSVAKDPGERTFDGFQRGPDGRFNDDELVESIATAIEQPGGAFGAQNVPRIMKPVEILGIIRGRRWNLAGLNEFRKHFGLKAYETFEDINSDPAVADNLRQLYQHPDCVELYPGIVAEEGKAPMVPGVGIAPTYTISRVVLSDAVALVRGDRYYTTDYHPGNLTNWGYREVDYDLEVNHGCVFYKLFLRAFPNHFKKDSVYAHYPMVIPSENKKILTNLKRAHRFNFDKPQRGSAQVSVNSYAAAQHVLTDAGKYQLAWQQSFKNLKDENSLAASHTPKLSFTGGQERCAEAFTPAAEWKACVKSFYAKTAERLLSDKSFKMVNKKQVDLVRDVGNLAHTHFVAELLNLSPKTKQNPKGVLTEREVHTALSTMFVCGVLDTDPVKSFPLKQQTKVLATQLGGILEGTINHGSTLGIRSLFASKRFDEALTGYGTNLIKGLSKAGLSTQDIVWNQLLPMASTLVTNQGQQFAQAVDFYLSPNNSQHLEELHRIASQESTEETDSLLFGYAAEGVRLAGKTPIYRQATANDTITAEDGREVAVNAGSRLTISLDTASRDPTRFPNPDSVDPRRPVDAHIHQGVGPQTCLDAEVGRIGLVELFRAVFRKNGLGRVKGPQGELKSILGPDGTRVYLTEDWGGTWPFATSMKVVWDE